MLSRLSVSLSVWAGVDVKVLLWTDLEQLQVVWFPHKLSPGESEVRLRSSGQSLDEIQLLSC